MFLMIKMKYEPKQKDDCHAQLFLELLCKHFSLIFGKLRLTIITAAVELNYAVGFGDLRVFGLLTDLRKCHFYSYLPKEGKKEERGQFFSDQTIRLTNSRDLFLSGMIEGTHI